MSDGLISQLLDFGALGVFASFLIWQHLGMQRRLDALVERFQEQLKEIDNGFERRIEIMRDRYDVVIRTARAECREERDAIAKQRDDLQELLVQIHLGTEKKLDQALERLQSLNLEDR